MAVATLRNSTQQAAQISWGLPAKDNEATSLSDYHAMIRQAERGEGMTFEQYTEKTHEWLQKNL